MSTIVTLVRQMETDGLGASLEERGFFKRPGRGGGASGGQASVQVRLAPVMMESGGFGDSTDERIFFTGPPSSREPVQAARAAARKAAAGLMRKFVARGVEDEAHCERVATWSRRLAKELGLSSDRVLDIELGALLHDIGFIELSSFPGKGPVKPADWLEFRGHPELGAALLEPIPLLRRAIPLVLAHEEHFDGTGYPKGQKGTEIPISARIFHVVDAYEAMTNDLTCLAPCSDAEARARIELDAGARFDPIVCAALDCIEPAEWRDLVATLR
jgi:response regulator RpfG family c-di-GMP phosphodiesterase